MRRDAQRLRSRRRLLLPTLLLLLLLVRLCQCHSDFLADKPHEKRAVLVEKELLLQMIEHADVAGLQSLKPEAAIVHDGGDRERPIAANECNDRLGTAQNLAVLAFLRRHHDAGEAVVLRGFDLLARFRRA